ncbi:hypothetical protein JZK55_22180 [Dissulfurispira thermophila]|uniref:Glycosyltransferase n=1 Tax=Dissulfurispira thermophila TaxID=2715679 RepID=A0A7G1H5U6_9BACT|nr:hypothetical protein [Dissulfurispira thermophila]BCB97296.1 hypothetical protein JZK55_22180 [Dissulfurispira thermophila]
MKILCITDQFENSNHSSIEGIFGTYLKEWCKEVYIVYFIKTSTNVSIKENKIYIPYSYKRKNITRELDKIIGLNQIDSIIVRNFFPVLKNVLKNKIRYNYRVGFWHSFPHTFRRLFEAKEENRAVFRKTIEYKLKTYFEKNLVKKCDFLIVMSREFKNTFYPDIDINYLSLPMGVCFNNLPSYKPNSDHLKKFIYTGTVDHLRKTDIIVEAISELKEEFIFDIFTQSSNKTTKKIKNIGDGRINIYPAIPRNELFKRIADYDIGIGLIPENDLYSVSSPTKTLEYYSIGVPVIVNYLPEYVSLFDNMSAFFCDFTKESIRETVQKVLNIPKEKLFAMGLKGKQIVKEQRDYRVLSEKLYNFIKDAYKQQKS